MKKTQLIKLIRESIKKLREEKGPLNEAPGCYFDTQGTCGPGYCSEYQESDGGFTCGCNSFIPMTDDCDTTDTGGRSGDRGNKNPTTLNETEKNYCVCKTYKCLRDPQSGGNSTISYGGCTGSGACSCINNASYGPTNISKKTINEAKKIKLTERFQQLAGIRPLYELEKELLDFEGNNVYDIIHRDMMAFYKMDVSRDKIKNWADNYSWRDGEVIFDTGEREDFFQFIEDGDEYEEETGETGESRAAAVLSHDDYKSVYFGDEEEFEEEGFEFIETFNPSSPYTFVMWNDEDLDVYDYASEEEFIVAFSEMGFGMCDDRECGMAEIMEVINDSQPDRDSAFGLALLANGKEIANGGE